jgi:hypothetical protein
MRLSFLRTSCILDLNKGIIMSKPKPTPEEQEAWARDMHQGNCCADECDAPTLIQLNKKPKEEIKSQKK